MQGSHRTFPTTPREPRWYASAGQLLIRGQVASWARFPLRGCAAKSEDVPWMEGATLCSWRAVGRGQCAANIPQCTGHPRQRHILPKKAGVPGRELLLHAGISPAAPCCLSRGPPQGRLRLGFELHRPLWRGERVRSPATQCPAPAGC